MERTIFVAICLISSLASAIGHADACAAYNDKTNADIQKITQGATYVEAIFNGEHVCISSDITRLIGGSIDQSNKLDCRNSNFNDPVSYRLASGEYTCVDRSTISTVDAIRLVSQEPTQPKE